MDKRKVVRNIARNVDLPESTIESILRSYMFSTLTEIAFKKQSDTIFGELTIEDGKLVLNSSDEIEDLINKDLTEEDISNYITDILINTNNI